MRVTKPNYFSIAGILLNIVSDKKYLHKELMDFAVPKGQFCSPDVCISISEEEYIGNHCGKILLKGTMLTVIDQESSYLILYNIPTCVSCYQLSKSAYKAVIYLTEEAKNPIQYPNGDSMVELMYSIRDSFFFYLQKFERVVVHSASIVYNNEVWLFSAPSGTGKSTHVQLWKDNGYPIKDFNGDLTVCYMDKCGDVIAAGIPWCGTSGIYKNQKATLGGMLFLQRSETDFVRPLDPFQGSLHILGRCVTPNWTKEQADINANVAEKISCKVHLALLYCTMNNSAAVVSKQYIDNISK